MKYLSFLIFLLLVCLSCSPVKSEINTLSQENNTILKAAKATQTYIVIIAIADYKYGTAQQGDLRYTKNDARKFYELITQKEGWNIPTKNIALLMDAQATKINILYALKTIFSKAKSDDRVIFYYTGHGLADYVIPYDAAQPKTDTYLSYDDIKAMFRMSKAATKLAIIDACFANSIKTISPKTQVSKKANRENSNQKEQVIIMASAQSYQTAREYGNLNQGVFSYFLITGLEGRADKNKDRVITIGELHQFVFHNVKAYTQNQQNPHTFGHFKVDMPVVVLD